MEKKDLVIIGSGRQDYLPQFMHKEQCLIRL